VADQIVAILGAHYEEVYTNESDMVIRAAPPIQDDHAAESSPNGPKSSK
jgi:hypothetical protein